MELYGREHWIMIIYGCVYGHCWGGFVGEANPWFNFLYIPVMLVALITLYCFYFELRARRKDDAELAALYEMCEKVQLAERAKID